MFPHLLPSTLHFLHPPPFSDLKDDIFKNRTVGTVGSAGPGKACTASPNMVVGGRRGLLG